MLQVEQYTRLLNSAGCRAGRPKLDPHNIVYWFKNTRAALRRAETRHGGEAARSVFMVCYGETVVTVELMFVRKEAGAEAGAEREVATATAVAGQRQVEQQGRYLASNN